MVDASVHKVAQKSSITSAIRNIRSTFWTASGIHPDIVSAMNTHSVGDAKPTFATGQRWRDGKPHNSKKEYRHEQAIRQSHSVLLAEQNVKSPSGSKRYR
jgi:hypothetical protein